MHVIRDGELRSLVSSILRAAGADARNADRVAEALVSSNLAGVDTHGVMHLPGYVKAIGNDEIVPTAWPEVLSETPATALVSGNWGLGHVTAKYAMELAIEKGREQGIAIVGTVQTNHIGRLGEYAELAASRGMIGLVWAGGYGEQKPMAVPFGGSKAVLHTNPLAMGFPAGDEPTIVLDFATTAIAGSKVLLAQQGGKPVPPDALVDKHGNPTTDPATFNDGGAQLPFGGHKGYAIMLAVEYLSRILLGTARYADPSKGGIYMRDQGVSMMAFKADLFQPLDEFEALAAEMERRVRAVPPAPGFDEVIVPGDPEARNRAERTRNGIPITDEIWASLVVTAESLGVSTG